MTLILAPILALAALIHPPVQPADQPRKAKAKHKHHRAKLRPATVTAYCLTGRMANGRHVHPGAAASVTLPLGTRIRFTRPVLGRRTYRITDTGRLASDQIDVWTPSCRDAIVHGRRARHYRIVRPRVIAQWKATP